MAAPASPAHTATGDMSNPAALACAALAVELDAATAAMHQARHNRTGIAYTDAKMRVAVFGAEQRRRAAEGITVADVPAVVVEAEAIVAAEAAAHTCTSACTGAISHPEFCRCVCGGENHGGQHVAGRRLAAVGVRNRITRTGDVTLGAAATDDEPVAVNYRGRTLLLDPEDVF